MVYNYNVAFSVYSRDADGTLVSADSTLEDSDTMQTGQSPMESTLQSSITGENPPPRRTSPSSWRGADGSLVSNVVTDSYDVLYGSWPQAYNEVMLVLDENNSIPVQTLYQLGLITADQYRQAEDEIAEDGQASELPAGLRRRAGPTFLPGGRLRPLPGKPGRHLHLPGGRGGEPGPAAGKRHGPEDRGGHPAQGRRRQRRHHHRRGLHCGPVRLPHPAHRRERRGEGPRRQTRTPTSSPASPSRCPTTPGRPRRPRTTCPAWASPKRPPSTRCWSTTPAAESSGSSAAMGTMVLDEASQAAALDQYLAGEPLTRSFCSRSMTSTWPGPPMRTT